MFSFKSHDLLMAKQTVEQLDLKLLTLGTLSIYFNTLLLAIAL